MARPECSCSLGLEQRMNLQIRLMTIQDYMRYGGTIDESDDGRRKEAFGFDKHTEDMLTYFMRILDEAIVSEDWEKVKYSKSEIEIFRKTYSTKKKSLHELELHYEELDDQLREWIMEYLATCLEKTRDESSKIDLQMIRENLDKKRKKKSSSK